MNNYLSISTAKYRKTQLTTLMLCMGLSQALFFSTEVRASGDLWDMSLDELGKIRVTSIASGTQTPLDKAAAIATVITEDDIAAMGATDLDQVLESVPGLHVSRHPITYTPKYNIRGITSTYNPQTLILINGVAISSLYVGSPSLAWAGMPIKSIARIEVIRGPGSALYGADAFAGVINITTKRDKDIPNGVIGVNAGSFNTRGGWLSYGTRANDINMAATLEYSKTAGFDSIITADAQTFLDTISGTHASLAPGKVNTGKESIEARIELDAENWIYRLGYQGRDKIGTGAGVAQALNSGGIFSSDRINTDFTYNWYNLAKDWSLSARASYYYADQQAEQNNFLYPAGTNTVYPLGTFPNEPLFPNGVIGNPEYREEQARLSLDAHFDGYKNHIIRLGTGFFWGDLYEVTEQKNFGVMILPNGAALPLTPRANGLEEVADTAEIFLPEKDRTSYSLYAQDEWMFDHKWVLTSGVRYDNYSDFGDAVNPRLALVWATTNAITTKLLYGRAFRAPSISELFATSNPVALGNPNLKPESIDSYELAFSHQVSPELLYTANMFYYNIKDYISFVTGTVTGARQAQNIGEIKGHGFEAELTYQAFENLRIVGNYAYQTSTDKTTSHPVGDTPNHQIYLRPEWQVIPDLSLNAQVNWIGSQQRSAGDNRADVASYTSVDFILRKKELISKMDISVVIANAFDTKIFEPSLPPLAPFFPVAFVPNDHPMAGRSLNLEVQYQF